MKKIFKKSLALAVSAALCLTALVGCLTVSAAGTATASISTANVANGSTSATITVTIGSADDQVAAARFNLVVPTGITLDTSAFDSTATNGDGYTPEGKDFTVISNGNMFLLEAENEVVKGGSASFDIPVTIADGTVATTYAVSFGDVLEVANYGTYDSTTQTWSNDEALLTVSSTNGGVTVAAAVVEEEDLITYTTVSYEVATSKLEVSYAAPSNELKAVLSAAKTAGNRKIQLIANVGGTEFAFDTSIYSAGGTLNVSGFALPHMDANISIFVRITADNDYLVETNAKEVVLADVISEMAATDTQAAALYDLYEAWQSSDETINITNAEIETGMVNYTSVTYGTAASILSVGYGAPSADLKAALSAAKTAGNRKVQLIANVGGAEFAFDLSIYSAGGTLTVSGFAIPHFTQSIEVFIRITADGGYLTETNSVTVDLDSAIKADNGTFATAYNAYVA